MTVANGVIELTYTNRQIQQMRVQVRENFCSVSNNIENGVIESISNADLQLLFTIYDDVFFDNYFENNYLGHMEFLLSRRLKRSAGITSFRKDMATLKPEAYLFKIKMSTEFIFNYDSVDRAKYVNGIKTMDSLEALMLVFEHELCHVIEYLHFQKTSCKGKRFKDLAKRLFGHTDVVHELPTGREIDYIKYGFRPGDHVIFQFEGESMYGSIARINKRATVMVESQKGNYLDQLGRRYIKCFVPLSKLKKKTHN